MKKIKIDDEGYLQFDDTRVTDNEFGQEILRHLQLLPEGLFVTNHRQETFAVEAFDAPLVALQVSKEADYHWRAHFPYDFSSRFALSSLTLDEWDRFHGISEQGVPFVFSRAAQAEFFNRVDDFTDQSIIVDGKEFILPNYLQTNSSANNESFWSDIYKNEDPGWELNEASPPVKNFLPKLKLSRQRVLVLGCGSGNDAAMFASQGHIVTAVDFSSEALARAKVKYGHLEIKFVEADAFKLPQEFTGAFDLVFEHTCFCAVEPSRRNELVKVWKRVLAPRGHLLGIFFNMYKIQGPPWGATEWELNERLKKHFRIFYWFTPQDSVKKRLGKELLLYAQVI